MSDREGEIAVGQLGLITRAQARQLGLGEVTVRNRLRSGRWIRQQCGVYAIAGAPDSEDRQLLAATLSAGPVAAASHRSAARRWGQTRLAASQPEISVDRERGLGMGGVTVHRSRDLHPDHITCLGALPVTTPARTLVDLGQVCPWYVVRDLLEVLIARHTITIDQAHAALALHSRRGRRGCGALRRVLDERALLDRPTESVLEAAFADLCHAHGLPVPAFQFEVQIDGTSRFLDFAYPELLLAIELDGFEFHATAAGFTADRVRGNQLALLGWTVLHFTWQQVIHQPEQVARTIRRALVESARNRG